MSALSYGVYNLRKTYYSFLTLSNQPKIKEISETLKEPEWLFAWRKKSSEESNLLPRSIKHGIGISALFPETEPTYDGNAEYHVDASKGIEIYTWKEAVTQEEIEPILKGLLESDFFPASKDFFRASALAHFRSGLVVYVQPNMKEDGTFIEETLSLDTIVSGTSSADVVVIILKEGAKCRLMSTLRGGGEGSVHARALIVLAEADTTILLTEVDQLAKGAMAMHSSRAIVAANANICWRELFVGDSFISAIAESMLIGSGAKSTLLQGTIGEGAGIFDLDAREQHIASDTASAIRTAGVAYDSSRTLFRGLVDMRSGVKNVLGRQEARFLALSEKAKIDAIPSLDIASNDVTCSHKLTISHVREGDTFYPKLRGLSDDESRTLFLEGHFAAVFDGEEHADIMKQINEHIHRAT